MALLPEEMNLQLLPDDATILRGFMGFFIFEGSVFIADSAGFVY